jgi:PAS domain S-box-containing protein
MHGDEALLTVMMDGIADAVVVFDEEGTIRLANEEAGIMFDATGRGLVGLSIHSLVPTLKADGNPAGGNLRAFRPNGAPFDLSAALRTISAGGERLFVGTLRATIGPMSAEVPSNGIRARLADAQRLAKVGSWTWIAETDVLDCSDEFHRILGLIGKTIENATEDFPKLIHPDDRDRVVDALRKAISEGAAYDIEYRVTRPVDGEEAWVHTAAELVRDPEGKVVTISGTAQDITGRKQAEAGLERTVSLLQATLDATNEGILVIDRDRNVTRFNNKFLEMWRIPRSIALSGSSRLMIDSVLPQLKDPDGFIRKVTELYDAPEAECFDTLEFHDGRVFERYSVPQRLGDTIVGRVWSFRDVTERRRAEETLRESEKELRAILDNMLDTYYRTDAGGRMVMTSPEATSLLGYSLEELNGMPLVDNYADPADRREFLRQLEENGGELRGHEARLQRKDGKEIWVSTNARYYFDENGNIAGVEGVTRDVTQQKIAVAAVRAAKEQAETANRAKTEFLANMSHELRTPLNSVIGFSEILAGEMFGPLGSPQYMEYVQHINESGKHLLGLIKDILDVSQIETGNFELTESHVDIAPLVDTCAALVNDRVARSGLTLSTNIGAGLPTVFVDELRLKQILLNLLTNAVKFTPEGGKVTLTAGLDDDGGLLFSVTDTGIGIASEDFDGVLKAFVQAEGAWTRTYEGAGLGLPIAKQLVELHGGTLDLDSELAVGTTVTFRLPPERMAV